MPRYAYELVDDEEGLPHGTSVLEKGREREGER